jgi:uncharacterized protein (DUF427 family)
MKITCMSAVIASLSLVTNAALSQGSCDVDSGATTDVQVLTNFTASLRETFDSIHELMNALKKTIMSSSSTTKQTLNPRNFPRPPLCEPTQRHLEIKWNGHLIASTTSAYWVLETHHPPTYYLPPSALKVPVTANTKSSFCEWKGRATYYDIANPANPSEVVRSRAWSYDSPTPGFKDINGYLSFYAGPWDCFVDGEKVEAQPGDFYGGWMTSDIEREAVKGAPGTLFW